MSSHLHPVEQQGYWAQEPVGNNVTITKYIFHGNAELDTRHALSPLILSATLGHTVAPYLEVRDVNEIHSMETTDLVYFCPNEPATVFPA